MVGAQDPVFGTVVITGATSGIGYAAALALAGRGQRLVLVGRDPARLERVAREAARAGADDPQVMRADFARLRDVRVLADQILSCVDRIDVFAGNAGHLAGRRVVTEDGFESTIQVNHLAGFLLMNLLRPAMSGGRVVLTSSDAHLDGDVDPDDLNGVRRAFHPGVAYGASKQANILTAGHAARIWDDVLPVSFHPGQVRTRFGRGTIAAPYFRLSPLLRSARRGADTLCWLATADAAEIRRGAYYTDRRPQELTKTAACDEPAARLWAASCAAVGLNDPETTVKHRERSS